MGGGVVCEWEGRPAQRVVWTAQQAPRACWRGYRCGWVGMGAMCELQEDAGREECNVWMRQGDGCVWRVVFSLLGVENTGSLQVQLRGDGVAGEKLHIQPTIHTFNARPYSRSSCARTR